jgi:hypothetical protein
MSKISKNQKGFTMVEALLMLLILVVIGGVGYMVYHNNHKNNTDSTASKTTTNSSSNKSTAIANPYAGWQQLCSSSGGLCMKYPSDWKLSGSDSDAYTITSPSGETAVAYDPNGAGMDAGAYTLAGAGGSECPSDILSITPLTTNANNLEVLKAIINCTANVNSNVTSSTPAYTFISNSKVTSQNLKAGETIPDIFNIGIGGSSSLAPQLIFIEDQSGSTYSTSTAAQQWFSSSDVQTAVKILSSVSYGK